MHIISGRPFDIREHTRGSNLKHCDLPVTELRLSYKPKKISSSTNLEKRVPGGWS